MILFRVCTNAGLDTLLTKNIAQNKIEAQRFTAESTGMLLPLAIFTLLLMHSSAVFLGFTALERSILFALSFYLVFDSWGRYCCAIFRGFEKMQYETIVMIFERSAMFFVTLICWQLNYSLLYIVWGLACVQFLKWLLAGILVSKFFFPWNIQFNYQKVAQLLKIALPFALVVAFDTVTTRIDIVMLKMLHGDSVAGNYNAARRLLESISFIPENIYNSLLPAASLLFLQHKKKYVATFQTSFQLMITVAIPLSIVLFALAPAIIHFLLPEEFNSAITAFKLLSIVSGFLFLKFTFAAALNSSGKQMWMSGLVLAGMLTNIILNTLLIPSFDILGAGIATIASELLMAVLGVIWLRRFLGISVLSRSLWMVCFSAIVAAGSFWLDYGVFGQCLMFILLYLVLLNWLGVLPKNLLSSTWHKTLARFKQN